MQLGGKYETLYCACVAIFTLLTIATSTVTSNFFYVDKLIISRSLNYGISGLLFLAALIMCIKEKRSLQYYLAIPLTLLILTPVIMTSHLMSLLPLVVFVFAYPKGLHLARLAKVLFWASTLGVICVFLQCGFGLVPDIVGTREDGKIRSSFGFSSPNALGTTITIVLMLYMFSRYESWSVSNNAFCIVAGVASFLVTNSRMAFILLILGLLLINLRNCALIKSAVIGLMPYLSVIIFLAYLIAVYGYSALGEMSLFGVLNELLSRRLDFASSFFGDYSIGLLGQQLTTISMSDIYYNPNWRWYGLDGSYGNLLLRTGVIFTGLTLLIYMLLGFYLRKTKSYICSIIVLLVLLLSFTENILFQPALNFTVYIIGYAFINDGMHIYR